MADSKKPYPTFGAFVARYPHQAFAYLSSGPGCYHDPAWICRRCFDGFAMMLRLNPDPVRKSAVVESLFEALLKHAEELELRTKVQQRVMSKDTLIGTLSFLNADFRQLHKLPGVGPKKKEMALRLQQGLGLAVYAQRAVHGVDLNRQSDHRPGTPEQKEFYDKHGYRYD